MTDKDVIKALECCVKAPYCNEKTDCPYKGIDDCVKKHTLDALDLINRQQKQLDNYSHNVRTMTKDFNEQYKIIKQQQAEIERLKEEVKAEYGATFLAIAEVIKEFADRLKTKKIYSIERHEYIVPVAVIDWTEKEMVGEGK